MDVFTVHGIRRKNRWNEELVAIDSISENHIEIISFDYGFFSIWKFLRKSKREEIIDQFCKFYYTKMKKKSNPPCLIAHSFGTYIVYMAMKRHKSIKFKTIIFCGSILNTKLDFREQIENKQFEKLINDHGDLENFVLVTRILVDKFCGNSGKKGFLDIPKHQYNLIENRKNYMRHSDYFSPLHIENNWVPELCKAKLSFSYKKSILRNQIIERIYQNIEKSKYDFQIEKIGYFARIDKVGNYYAKYQQAVFNNKHIPISQYSFTTTADGTNVASEMNIKIFDEDLNLLNYEIDEDLPNLKTIKVILRSPILPRQKLMLNNYFSWDKTIFLTGDTDHWVIKDIKNVFFQINFPFDLKSPRIYFVKDKEIVEQNYLRASVEKDFTYTYSYEFENNKNFDGLIFYFEGHINSESSESKYLEKKRIKSMKNSKSISDLSISKVGVGDIREIYALECEIEHGNAATEETLRNRMYMFNDGFLKLMNGKKIIGYIESIIWNEKPFRAFKDISNFPMHYNIRGSSMYIIFIAIKKSFRKKGYGKKLMMEIETIAKKYDIKKITLVAKDDLVDFYEKLGYVQIEELPNFLEKRIYKSVKMEKLLNNNEGEVINLSSLFKAKVI